jgi:soluble lytic murein transglycosylase-like protein
MLRFGIILLIVVLFGDGTLQRAYAGDPVEPGPGFKFVKAPKKSGAKPTGGSLIRRPPTDEGQSDWFWRDVSTRIEAANSDRIERLRKLVIGKYGRGRQIKLLRQISQRWRAEITSAAQAAIIAPQLLTAIIAAESSGDPNAVSRSGAMGLAQLMPETASRFNVTAPFDPQNNLTGAAAYLSVLLDIYSGDIALTLAAYNAGDGAVRDHQGVPSYLETRDYVPKVLSFLVAAEQECTQPLLGPRDQCQLK